MKPWPVWRVCSAGEVPDPGAREFQVGGGEWPCRGFIVHLDGHFHGWVNVCPHRQHPLNLQDDDFLVPGQRVIRCASHGALFDPESGLCLAGPCAGRSLTPLECWVEGDQIWVRAPDSLQVLIPLF